VQHALQYARDMGATWRQVRGMYVNHWTLDYGEKGRKSIRRFLSGALRGFDPSAAGIGVCELTLGGNLRGDEQLPKPPDDARLVQIVGESPS